MTRAADPVCPAAFRGAGETAAPEEGFVTLLGFDFGSTTSSVVAARARISAQRCSERVALEQPRVVFRPTPEFTPFAGDDLDIPALRRIIKGWMDDGGLSAQQIFSGGAIITGLAAAGRNAAALADLVRSHTGNALIATADDPALESWLAFMGSCHALSRRHPDIPILNLDIGGGTTNSALGLNGDVLGTGCAFIGARHFRFLPGTYKLAGISCHGKRLLEALNMPLNPGDLLECDARDRLVAWMVRYLEEMATGRRNLTEDPRFAFLEQMPMALPRGAATPMVTFSGGVGELVYAAAMGKPLPGDTAFGDLGIDLARRIAASPTLSRHLPGFMSRDRGHATVMGLALHHTEISGTTLFLPHPERLPLRDLPIVARLGIDDGLGRIEAGLAMVNKCTGGGAVRVGWESPQTPGADSAERLRRFAGRVTAVMISARWPRGRPLVLLMSENCGKALGNYVTRWGKLSLPLVVLDEIPERQAQFVTVGRMNGGLVPISFFGMHRGGMPSDPDPRGS